MSIATILPMAASMESLLLDIEKNLLTSKLSILSETGVSLAAACTAISLIGTGSQYLKGHNFDWWKFFRPILIFFLVWNFSTLVLNPLRGMMGFFNTKLVEVVGGSVDEFKQTFKERAEEMCHEQFGSDDEVWSVDEANDNWLRRNLKSIGNYIMKGFYDINEKVNLGASQLVAGIFFFFINLWVSVMIIIAHIYLIFMALIGPTVFALAIINAFPKGLKLWVEKYIQYTLWQPILYIIMAIGTEILVQGNQTASWGGFWTWLFMCISIFTVIRQTPALASFVIEGSGAESLANQMSGIGSQVLQKASSTAMILR